MIVTDYVLPFLLLISVLIAFHEGGHFLVARMLGIRVVEFSIGMGPLLLSRIDRKGCRWQVRVLPLGGYVQMFGDADAASVGTAPLAAASDEERRAAYHARPVWQRSLVILGGPVANLVLGFILVTGLYALHGRETIVPVAVEIVAGSPAERAGLAVGDRIVAVDGIPVSEFADVIALVSPNVGRPVVLTVERRDGDTVRTLTLTPEPEAQEGRGGRIGVRSDVREVRVLTVIDAVRAGTVDIWRMSIGTIEGVLKVVSGQRPLDDLGGPVKIAEISGEAVKVGWATFVLLAAVVSINLGVMNLLPIPVLDGGHLLIHAIEAVRGRPPSPAAMSKVYKGSVALLIGFFVLVTINDVLGLLAPAVR